MDTSKITFKLPWFALLLVVSVLGVGEGCNAGEFTVVEDPPGGTECIACNTCPTGSGSNIDCDYGTIISRSQLKTVKCVPCVEGVSYKETKSYKECSDCTVCPPGTFVISLCTTIRNTQCGITGKSSTQPTTTKVPIVNATKSTFEETSSPRTPETTDPLNATIRTENSKTSDGIIAVSVIVPAMFIVLLIGVGVLCRRKTHRNHTRLGDNGEQVAGPCGNSNVSGPIYVELGDISDEKRQEAERKRRVKATESVKSLPPNYSDKQLRQFYGDTPFTIEKKMVETISTLLGSDDIERIYDGWLVHLRSRQDNPPPPVTIKDMFALCRTLAPKWTIETFLNLLIEIGRSDVVEKVCKLLNNQQNIYNEDQVEYQV